MKHYEIGQVVKYKTFGGEVRKVKVTLRESNIKNGRAGFDGVDLRSRRTVWGYDEQIIGYKKETKPETFSPIG